MKQRPPERFADWDAHVAWDYDGVVTAWRLERDGEIRYLKVRKIHRHHYTLADERDRMVWAGAHVSVPEVLDHGMEGDVEWLLLMPLPGASAATDEMKTDKEWIVRTLGTGLREFHERLDPSDCPFDFRNDVAIAHVTARLKAGIFDRGYDLHDEFKHYSPSQALARLEALRPASEDLVVCHGDYCFPNVLLEDGRITGYLDLGELGIADRWCDVAVGAWSTTWNVGPGYEELFYDSYGIEPDPARIEYYRLLYSLAS